MDPRSRTDAKLKECFGVLETEQKGNGTSLEDREAGKKLGVGRLLVLRKRAEKRKEQD